MTHPDGTPVLEHDARCPELTDPGLFAEPDRCTCRDDDGHTPRTPWSDGPMLVLDTETTGVDTETDRIVTATVVELHPGQDPVIHTWLADPGVAIPQAATDVHGITEEHAAEHGRPAVDVVDEIDRLLGTLWNANVPLIVCNASFDLSLLDAELRRHHSRQLRLAGPVIDPLIIDKHIDRYRKGKRRLENLCAHYRVRIDGAHDATADCLAAARVVWRIAREYPAIGGADLRALHTDQIGWYATQQRSFAKYLRDKVAPTVEDFEEQAGVLTRADQVDAAAGHWPMRGAS